MQVVSLESVKYAVGASLSPTSEAADVSIGESFDNVLAAAKQGAEWAWAELYREYAGALTGYLTGRGVNEAEDIANEVFMQVARQVSQFEGDERSFRSWLFVIARGRLVDELRARTRRPSLAGLPDNDSTGGDVEVEALDRLRTDELKEAFGKLSEGQRDVLALRIIAGLTIEETAETLDMSVSAVKAMQRRGIQTLQASSVEGAR